MELMEISKRKNKTALDSILKRFPVASDGVTCPVCYVVWNKLTPNGICIDCDDLRVKSSDKPKDQIG